MSDVFISYVEKDRALALALADGLEAAGFTTWYYARDYEPGVDYLTLTGQKIDECYAVLIVVSPNSLRSSQTHKQVIRAHEAHKPLILVLSGVELAEVETQRPAWQQAMDAAVSILSLDGVREILPRIIRGLHVLLRADGEDQVRADEELGAACPAPEPPADRGGHGPGGHGPRTEPQSPACPRPPTGVGSSGSTGFSPLPSPGTAELPGPITDRVHFTATAPPSVVPGTDFLLQVWGHLDDQRGEVLRRARRLAKSRPVGEKGPVALSRGTVLRVRLSPIEDLEATEAEDTIFWDGEIGTAAFRLSVSATARPGPRVGTITFYVADLAVATLGFTLTVGSRSTGSDHLPSQFKRYRTAFASYASENRDAVLLIIEGLQKGMPDLQVFLDVANLRSGVRWKDEIQRVIPIQDVFYLFWSRAASRSRFVEGEWRCALRTRGLDFIDVAPLDSPEVAPPPDELRSLHFGDWTLAFRRHSSA